MYEPFVSSLVTVIVETSGGISALVTLSVAALEGILKAYAPSFKVKATPSRVTAETVKPSSGVTVATNALPSSTFVKSVKATPSFVTLTVLIPASFSTVKAKVLTSGVLTTSLVVTLNVESVAGMSKT